MKIDILFIHPNASKKIYQDLSKDHAAIEPPIWAGMLNSACLNKGFKSEILDCEVNHFDYEKSAEVINDLSPKIACFVVYGQQPSASSQNMEGAVEVSNRLKNLSPNIKIFFVGGHVAALPYETLKNEKSIDIVANNEGVISTLNLLQLKNLDDVSLKKLMEFFFEIKMGILKKIHLKL